MLINDVWCKILMSVKKWAPDTGLLARPRLYPRLSSPARLCPPSALAPAALSHCSLHCDKISGGQPDNSAAKNWVLFLTFGVRLTGVLTLRTIFAAEPALGAVRDAKRCLQGEVTGGDCLEFYSALLTPG